MEEEISLNLNALEQQISQLQEQISILEQTTNELNLLKQEINELVNSKGKEILASIGRGIYVKAKIQSEDLIVDVGGKNFVKKSISETKRLIDEQIEKMNAVREELEKGLKKTEEEMIKMTEQKANLD